MNQSGEADKQKNQSEEIREGMNQGGEAGRRTNRSGKSSDRTNPSGEAGRQTNRSGKSSDRMNRNGESGRQMHRSENSSKRMNQNGEPGRQVHRSGKGSKQTNRNGESGRQMHRSGKSSKRMNQNGESGRQMHRSGKISEWTNPSGEGERQKSQSKETGKQTNRSGKISERTNPSEESERQMRQNGNTAAGIKQNRKNGVQRTWSKRIAENTYRFRYGIGLILFLLCLLFRVSGSSIGYWSLLLDQPDPYMIGESRGPRSDEWGMLTAMCLAQENNPAGAYERELPVGEDVGMDQGVVYAVPSRDFLALFRPFYWGYLLFGSEVGLAWYWCGRFLALFFAMFELGMVLTKGDRLLSLFLGICVCFAPFLQWWFAVNGLVEMLIYGSGFLLGFRYLLVGGEIKEEEWVEEDKKCRRRSVPFYCLKSHRAAVGRTAGIKGGWESIGKEAGKTVGKKAGTAAGKTIGKAVGKTAGKAAGKETGKAIGKIAGKTAGKTVGKIAGKTAGKTTGKSIAMAAMMAVCLVGYVLTFYPAWMAPVAYGFLPVFIWMIWEGRKSLKRRRKRDTIESGRGTMWFPWTLFVLLTASGFAYLLITSWDTILALLQSSYPGKAAISQGGGAGFWLLKYPLSLTGVRMDDPSVIENSSVICFAPIGLIVSLWIVGKEKKPDRLLLLLLGVEAVLTWYYCMGTTPWIAKLFLLNYTNAHRGPQVIGFLRLFVLIRALSCKEQAVKRLPAAGIAGAAAVFAVGISWCYTKHDSAAERYEYWTSAWMVIAVTAVLFVVFYLFLRYEKGKMGRRYGALGLAGMVVFLSGFRINPVRFGTDVITESAVYQEIHRIAEADPDGVWLELGIDYPVSNLVTMAGGISLTASQTCPELERWEIFGQDEEQVEVYNRYCHVRAVLSEEIRCTLLQTDYVQMELNEEALKTLSVDYVLTRGAAQMALADGWEITFEPVAQCGEYEIYRCLY